MENDPSQYYHPIVQAFMQGIQQAQETRLRQASLAQQNEQFKARQIADQEQEKRLKDQFAQEMELKKHQQALETTIAHISNIDKLAELRGKGLFNPEAMPNPEGVGANLTGDVSGFNLPNGMDAPVDRNEFQIGEQRVPRGIFSSAEQMGDWRARQLDAVTGALSRQSGAIKGAEAGAEQPYALERIKATGTESRKTDEQKQDAALLLKIKSDQDAYTKALDLLNKRIAADKEIAAMKLAGKKVTEKPKPGAPLDPDVIQGMLPGIKSGQITEDDIDKDVPLAYRLGAKNQINALGYQILKPKQVETLSQLGMLKRVYEKYQLINEAINKDDFGQINSLQADVTSLMGNIAKSVGAEKGNLSTSDIKRAENTMPMYRYKYIDPAANARRLKEFHDLYLERANEVIPKDTPADQRAELATQHNLMHKGQTQVKINVNPKDGKKYYTGPADPKTGIEPLLEEAK